MRVKVLRIARKPVLSADLGELAWPVGQNQGAAFVIQPGIKRAIRVVYARAHKPPPGKLVIGRGIKAEGALEPCKRIDRAGDGRAGGKRRLVLLPPDKLAAQIKRLVDGPPHRLPAIHSVDAVEVRNKIAAEQIMPARIGNAEIKIRILRQVFIAAQVPHNAYV